MIKDPQGRIADTLLTLAEKNRAKIIPKSFYDFDITVRDLLKMVGLSDNRDEKILYSLFDTNKFLKIDQDRIKCYDLAELEKLVQYYRKKTIMDSKIAKEKIR